MASSFIGGNVFPRGVAVAKRSLRATMAHVLINFEKDSHWGTVVRQEEDHVLVRWDANGKTDWMPRAQVDFSAWDSTGRGHRKRTAYQPVNVSQDDLESPYKRKPKRGYPKKLAIDAEQPRLPAGWKPPTANRPSAKNRKTMNLRPRKSALPKKAPTSSLYGPAVPLDAARKTVPVCQSTSDDSCAEDLPNNSSDDDSCDAKKPSALNKNSARAKINVPTGMQGSNVEASQPPLQRGTESDSDDSSGAATQAEQLLSEDDEPTPDDDTTAIARPKEHTDRHRIIDRGSLVRYEHEIFRVRGLRNADGIGRLILSSTENGRVVHVSPCRVKLLDVSYDKVFGVALEIWETAGDDAVNLPSLQWQVLEKLQLQQSVWRMTIKQMFEELSDVSR